MRIVINEHDSTDASSYLPKLALNVFNVCYKHLDSSLLRATWDLLQERLYSVFVSYLLLIDRSSYFLSPSLLPNIPPNSFFETSPNLYSSLPVIIVANFLEMSPNL